MRLMYQLIFINPTYNYRYTLNVSATQQLHQIILEQKNETNDLKTDLKTRLARLEAIINSSSIVDGTTNNGTDS